MPASASPSSESPAVEIALGIAKLGCNVLAVEPNVEELPQKLCQPKLGLTSLEEALAEADVVCVLVKHRAFTEVGGDLRQQPMLIDAVGL
jgi:UDP-N-acetyl-D-mannosaminuronic acid dehydrogenase